MKRFVLFMFIVSMVSISCNTLTNPPTQTREPVPPTESTVASVPPTEQPKLPAKINDIRERLDELGGERCQENQNFTCVTITVPLDHFDSSNTETIDVVFAVAPAREKRLGMYIQAFPGGPGGKGITYASTYYFSSDITKNYDVVFFDQRGVGLSNPLECKNAHAEYFLAYLNTDDNIGEEGYDTPEEQQAAIQKAQSFVDKCINEIGIDPNKLQFFTTKQVAEDIEIFRQLIGDDTFMLFGVSYGTAVAQTYARSHSEHLDGLILDGTKDTTLTGDEIAFSQWEGFNTVLLEVFKACDEDPVCSARMGGSSQAAYDELAQKLANEPIRYEFPVNGGTVDKLFTFNMLDLTVSYQIYGLNSRMDLMLAIADANKYGNMIPLAHLYFENANIDPASEEYLGSEGFSDTMYYIVWCSDDPYYSGSAEERSAKLMQEGQKLNGLIPRLDIDVIPLGLTCAFWPSAPTAPQHLEPLKAEGVPTFVLNATLDPATPFQAGKTVYENLADGYHIYVDGGEHGIYFTNQDCPSQYIDDFLVNGVLPDQREIVCDWDSPIFGQ